jgi:hypothetical protein
MMASISDRHDPWADAVRAAALLAVDPAGLNGAVVRAMPGPAREGWLSALKTMLPADAPMRRRPWLWGARFQLEVCCVNAMVASWC